MPVVFEQEGYRFFFYSNDHTPIHIHVQRGNGEAVFDVEGEVTLRESQGLKVKELSRAQELAEQYKAVIIKNGMSILVDSAKSAYFKAGQIVIHMESDVILRFPVADNPRLALGTPEQLNNIHISPFGLHWPDLDEDLSIRGIANGHYGQRQASTVDCG